MFFNISKGQHLFVKSFGGPGSDVANYSIVLSNGDFCTVGYYNNAGNRDAFVMRLTSAGDVIWSKTFGGSLDDEFTAPFEADNGDLILTGHSNSFTTLTAKMSVFTVRVTGTGTLIWSRTFNNLTERNSTNGVSNCYSYNISKTSRDEYIIGGHEIQNVSNSANSFHIIIDENGNLIKTVRDDTDVIYTSFGNSFGSLYAHSFVLSDDSRLVFEAPYSGSGYGRFDCGMTKFRPNGSVEFSKIYGGYQWDDGTQDVKRTPNGDFVIASNRSNEARTTESPVFHRVDSLGDLKWSASFNVPIGRIYPTAIVVLPTGEYVATLRETATNSNAYLIKFNETEIIWARKYGGNAAEVSIGLVKTPDGGFLLSGSTRSFGSGLEDAFLIKTDSLGRTDCYGDLYNVVMDIIPIAQRNRANPVYADLTTSAPAQPTERNPTFISTPFTISVTTTDDTICTNANDGVVTATVTGGSAPITYSWRPTGGNASSADSLGPGTYTVTVVDARGCEYIDTAKVTATILIVDTSFTATHCTLKDGTAAVNVVAGNGPFTYSWNTNPVQTTQSITCDSGTYVCRITDATGCFIDTTFHIPVVVPPLDLMLSDDTIVCIGDSALVGTPVSASSYLWNTGQTTDSIYAKFGFYSIIVVDNGCTYYDTVLVDNFVRSDQNSSEIICAGDSVKIGADAPATTYSWNTVPVQTTDSIFARTAGTYVLTLTENGCTYRDTTIVSVTPLPTFDLGANLNRCIDSLKTINSNTIADSYLWSTGESTSSIVVDTAGTYRLTVTTNGCSYTDSIRVIDIPLPVFSLGNDTTYCPNQSVQIGPVNNPSDTYRWSTNPVQTTNRINVQTPGSYRLSIIRQGCIYTDTINVSMYYSNLILQQQVTFCDTDSIKVGAQVPATTYSWNTTPVQTTDSIFISNPGQYILTALKDGCIIRDTVNAQNIPLPIFSLGPDIAICANTDTVIGTNVPADFYSWSSTIQNTDSLRVRNAGQYKLTITENGCSYSDSINLTHIPLPVFDLGPDTSICNNDLVTIGVAPFPATFLWNTGDVSSQILVDTGTYRLTITVNGCSSSDTRRVTNVIIPDLLSDTALCPLDTTWVDASCPGCTYLWDNGSTSAVQQIFSPTMRSVVITDANNCSFTQVIDVALEDSDCPPEVFTPGGFTPDGDGINDQFVLVGDNIRSIDLRIWDRWGELIHEDRGQQVGWDGTYKGKMCKTDVYIWQATVTFVLGETRRMTGHLTLLR